MHRRDKLAEALGRLLYLLHLGVILWWLLDKSPRQRATTALVQLLRQVLPSAALTLRLPPIRRFVQSSDGLFKEALFEGSDPSNGDRRLQIEDCRLKIHFRLVPNRPINLRSEIIRSSIDQRLVLRAGVAHPVRLARTIPLEMHFSRAPDVGAGFGIASGCHVILRTYDDCRGRSPTGLVMVTNR